MLELPHAVVGATIAVLIPNPVISIPLAFVSHFVMDLYPHWDPSIKNEFKKHGHITISTLTLLWSDSLLALAFGFSLAGLYLPNYSQYLNIIFSCFAAVFPDVIEIPLVIFRQQWSWLKKIAKLESQYQTKLPAPAGVYSQIIVLLICGYIIFSH